MHIFPPEAFMKQSIHLTKYTVCKIMQSTYRYYDKQISLIYKNWYKFGTKNKVHIKTRIMQRLTYVPSYFVCKVAAV